MKAKRLLASKKVLLSYQNSQNTQNTTPIQLGPSGTETSLSDSDSNSNFEFNFNFNPKIFSENEPINSNVILTYDSLNSFASHSTTRLANPNSGDASTSMSVSISASAPPISSVSSLNRNFTHLFLVCWVQKVGS